MAEPQSYIEINDFRPGIYSDLYASNNATAATAAPGLRGQLAIGNGAAVAENTYDCRADKTGALVPFWKRSNGPTRTMLPGGNGITGSYPTNMASNYLIDARAEARNPRSKVGITEGASFSTLLYGYFFRPSGAGNFYKFAHGVEFFGTNGSSMSTVFWARTNVTAATTDYGIPAGAILDSRAFRTNAFSSPFDPVYDYVVTADFLDYNSSYIASGVSASGTIAANELAFITSNLAFWNQTADKYDENMFFSAGFLSSSAIVKFLGGVYTISEGVYNADELTMRAIPVAGSLNTAETPMRSNNFTIHQGRLVFGLNLANVGATVVRGMDFLVYTPVNRPTSFYGTATGRARLGLMFPGDSPVGQIGAFGSITADQIIIVKSTGGVIIQGDLDRPTVRSLPFLEPTQDLVMQGVQTPLGFIYGSRNGIFTWAGGDASEHISPQLEGFFWDHTQGLEGNDNPYARYMGSRGRFGWWNRCVFVPNNYFFDVDGGGWWRLLGISGEPYNVYDTNAHGDLLSYLWRLTPTQNIPWHWYNRQQLGDAFSWQSQPIIETRGHVLDFQDIHLVCTYLGTGTANIVITLTGYTKKGVAVTPSVTTIQVVAGANPQLVWKDIIANFQAEYVQVRIQSTAGSSSSAAPKIHSIKFGVRDAARTPKDL